MARRENELRLSAEWQARFQDAERSPDTDWLECVACLQNQVAREFGFGQRAVEMLRTATSLYPEESFFQTVPLQVRYNRSRNGDLAEGCLVPAVELLRPSGQPCCLLDLGGADRPLVLIAGSHS